VNKILTAAIVLLARSVTTSIGHFLSELPILDQSTIHIIVGILTSVWLLLLASLVLGKGAPIKRYEAACALAAVSLLVIVFIARQTRRRAGPYQRDDEETTTPVPYHVRKNGFEQA
jgi:hypothetical protein